MAQITREELIELLSRVGKAMSHPYYDENNIQDVRRAIASLQAAEPEAWVTEDCETDKSATTYSFESWEEASQRLARRRDNQAAPQPAKASAVFVESQWVAPQFLTTDKNAVVDVQYNRKRIGWELERTAMGDGFYGNALRVAKDLPELSDEDRSVLDRYATGAQRLSDRIALHDIAMRIYAAPQPAPAVQGEPDDCKVICPASCHQFRAIPVQVQRDMIAAGFEPPFTAPPSADVDVLLEALEKIAAFQPKDIRYGREWEGWNRAGEYAASVARGALGAFYKGGGQ